MSDLPGYLLLALIVLLTVLSTFFSSSETAMIGLSRYRLRHLVKEKLQGARIANRLLRRVRDYAEVKGDGTVTQEIADAGGISMAKLALAWLLHKDLVSRSARPGWKMS